MAQLKQKLEGLGLDIRGKKVELLDRLNSYIPAAQDQAGSSVTATQPGVVQPAHDAVSLAQGSATTQSEVGSMTVYKHCVTE